MRCVACDVPLSEYESTIRSSFTGECLDLCCACIKEAGIKNFQDRPDLNTTAVFDEDDMSTEVLE